MSDQNYTYKPMDEKPQTTGPGFPPASRGSRFGASLVDGLIYLPGSFLLGIYISPALSGYGSSDNLFMLGLGGFYLLVVGIFNLVFLAQSGQTLGKRVLKIRINRFDSDEKAGFARIIFLRVLLVTLIMYIPIAGAIFALVNILFIFREDRRCLHDLIADTVVVAVGGQKESRGDGWK